MRVERNVRLNLDMPGRITFESLVCNDCGWCADAPQKSEAVWQATKHAEREGCREFELQMVETRIVKPEPLNEEE